MGRIATIGIRELFNLPFLVLKARHPAMSKVLLGMVVVMIFKYIRDKDCFIGGKGPFLSPFFSSLSCVAHTKSPDVDNLIFVITKL